jgi:hypothetical protein
MGDVADLKSVSLADNQELIRDCCRFQEGILSEANMRRKYGFAESVWENLGDDSALLESVEEEKLRRMRSGTAKKEKAQLHVMRAPDVAAKIMLDENANNRHRLDACKVLDDFSATGPASTPASDRFIITINLGADLNGNPIVEKYDKSIKIGVNDADPWNDDAGVAPAQAAITANKPAAAANKSPEELALESLMLLGD